MIEIAGGIILAVLFFAFLPVIIMLSVGIIGIGLLVILCVGIYFLSLNYVSSENAISITFSIFFISFLVFICSKLNWKFSDNKIDGNAVNTFYISADTSIEKEENIRKYLLAKEGINSVVINGYTDIVVSFNIFKISREDIEIYIDKLR